VLIRLSRDVPCLSMKQYLHVIEPMEEVGRRLGGWSRSDSGLALNDGCERDLGLFSRLLSSLAPAT